MVANYGNSGHIKTTIENYMGLIKCKATYTNLKNKITQHQWQ